MTADERAKRGIKRTIILAVAISFSIVVLFFESLAIYRDGKFGKLIKEKYFNSEKIIDIYSNNQIVLTIKDSEKNIYSLFRSRKNLLPEEDLRRGNIKRLYNVYKNDAFYGLGSVNSLGVVEFENKSKPSVKLFFYFGEEVVFKGGDLVAVETGRILKHSVFLTQAGTAMWSYVDEVSDYNKKRLLQSMDFIVSELIVHNSPFIRTFYINSENKRGDAQIVARKIAGLSSSYNYTIDNFLDLSDYEHGVGSYRFKLNLIVSGVLKKTTTVFNIKIKLKRQDRKGLAEVKLEELFIQEYLLAENMEKLEKRARYIINLFFGASIETIARDLPGEMVKDMGADAVRNVSKLLATCRSDGKSEIIYRALSDTDFSAFLYFKDDFGIEKKAEMIFSIEDKDSFKLKAVNIT